MINFLQKEPTNPVEPATQGISDLSIIVNQKTYKKPANVAPNRGPKTGIQLYDQSAFLFFLGSNEYINRGPKSRAAINSKSSSSAKSHPNNPN